VKQRLDGETVNGWTGRKSKIDSSWFLVLDWGIQVIIGRELKAVGLLVFGDLF